MTIDHLRIKRSHLYTPDEVAEMLAVDVQTVYRLIKAKKLKVLRVSERSQRIIGRALVNYLEAQQEDNDGH